MCVEANHKAAVVCFLSLCGTLYWYCWASYPRCCPVGARTKQSFGSNAHLWSRLIKSPAPFCNHASEHSIMSSNNIKYRMKHNVSNISHIIGLGTTKIFGEVYKYLDQLVELSPTVHHKLIIGSCEPLNWMRWSIECNRSLEGSNHVRLHYHYFVSSAGPFFFS